MRRKRIGRKGYETELERLHGDLVSLQHWVVQTGANLCVILEGREGAGKGEAIKAITSERAHIDLKSYRKWYDYSRVRDELFAATDTPRAPWYIADSNDKRRSRLNIITHLLNLIPYSPQKMLKIELPTPQRPDGYVEPELTVKRVAQRFWLRRRGMAGPDAVNCSTGKIAW